MMKNIQKKITDVVEDKAALGGRTLDAHLAKTRWKIRDSSHIRCEILKFRKIMRSSQSWRHEVGSGRSVAETLAMYSRQQVPCSAGWIHWVTNNHNDLATTSP